MTSDQIDYELKCVDVVDTVCGSGEPVAAVQGHGVPTAYHRCHDVRRPMCYPQAVVTEVQAQYSPTCWLKTEVRYLGEGLKTSKGIVS